MTTRSALSSAVRSSLASSRAAITCGPAFVKRWRNSTVSFCPATSSPTGFSPNFTPPISKATGPGVTASVPVFSTLTRSVTSRSVPTTRRESSIPDNETFRKVAGTPKSRSSSFGFVGRAFHASSRPSHAFGLSKRQPPRWASVKTTISFDAFVPSANPSVATPSASWARKFPPTGRRASSTPRTSARCVSGDAVFASGAGPPRTTRNAVPRGASLTSCFASSTAREKTVLPSSESSIEAEASITSATSRRPLASKRFRFKVRSRKIRPAAASSRTSADKRTIQRAFPASTKEPPKSAIPIKAAGSTKSHGTLESGGTKGRAIASAARPNSRQRAAMRSRSSHSILRFRSATVSKRKRIAPQLIGFAA